VRFRDLGRFPMCGRNLDALLKASEGRLDWLDLPAIRAAQARRDGIAHRLADVERRQVWADVQTIERQLQHWKVLQEDS